jgi:hypothetical protein
MNARSNYLLIHLALGVSLGAWYLYFFVIEANRTIVYERDFESYLLEGDAWTKSHEYTKAIEAFNESLRLKPASEKAYYRLIAAAMPGS